MELSYVFYQLKNHGFESWTEECLSHRSAQLFQLYTPKKSNRQDILYVLQSHQLPVQGPAPNIMLIISEKDVSDSYPESIVLKPTGLDCLINRLSILFTQYQMMITAVKDRSPDLFALMDQMEDTLKVPAVLIGGDLTGIAHSRSVSSMRFMNDETEAASIQTQIIWDQEFYRTQATREVFLYENHLLDQQVIWMLCFNIFVRKQFCARFALLCTEKWRIAYLMSVVDLLGKELEAYFKTSPEQGRGAQKTVAFFDAMRSVINGTEVDDIIDLNQFGWYIHQEYRIYVFRFDLRFPMKVSREYLQNKLEEFLGECFITDQQGDIICVCNRSISGFSFYESQERLVTFLSEHICKVGISNCFHDLLTTPKYIRQARWAMKLGNQKKPLHWYYYFRDYTYEYILEQSVREFPLEEIIMPELYTLMERDREKGSQLFETLELYVRNKCNGQATAKQLYIHRTTFLYRMKQIEELIHLDIQNEDVFKRLLISFSIYHKNK